MATIVTQYNPWREQMAVSFLAPILQGAIQNSLQSQQYKKQNALLGELAGGGQSTGVDFSGVTPPQQSGAPWMSSWNNGGGNALMQGFDNATEQIPMGGGGNKNIMDMARLMATSRFNMLNPEQMQKLAAPMFQYNAQQEAARQAEAAAAARQAQMNGLVGTLRQLSGQPLMNELGLAAVQGLVDKDMLKPLGDIYTPQQEFKTFSTNDRIFGGSFNPREGTFDPYINVPQGYSPDKVMQNNYDYAALGENMGFKREQLAEDARQFDISDERKQEGLAETQRHNRASEEISNANASRGSFMAFKGSDGKYHNYNRDTGEITPTGIGAYTAADGEPVSKLTDAERMEFNRRQAEIKDINSELSRLEAEYDDNALFALNSKNPAVVEAQDKRKEGIEELRAKRDALSNQLRLFLYHKLPEETRAMLDNIDKINGVNISGASSGDVSAQPVSGDIAPKQDAITAPSPLSADMTLEEMGRVISGDGQQNTSYIPPNKVISKEVWVKLARVYGPQKVNEQLKAEGYRIER